MNEDKQINKSEGSKSLERFMNHRGSLHGTTKGKCFGMRVSPGWGGGVGGANPFLLLVVYLLSRCLGSSATKGRKIQPAALCLHTALKSQRCRCRCRCGSVGGAVQIRGLVYTCSLFTMIVILILPFWSSSSVCHSLDKNTRPSNMKKCHVPNLSPAR